MSTRKTPSSFPAAILSLSALPFLLMPSILRMAVASRVLCVIAVPSDEHARPIEPVVFSAIICNFFFEVRKRVEPSFELESHSILVGHEPRRLPKRLEDRLYVPLQEEAPLEAEIMRKGDVDPSVPGDLAVLEEVRMVGCNPEIVQRVLHRELAP